MKNYKQTDLNKPDWNLLEIERHRCEVRQVLLWRVEDRGKAMSYLSLVRQKRGDQAADRLEKDCRTQWERGNRGEKGDWRGL